MRTRRTKWNFSSAAALVIFLLLAGVIANAETTPETDATAGPTPTPTPVPDTITINRIVNLWEAVVFTHGDHVNYAENCASCHHHSPAGVTPSCVECHRTGNVVEGPSPGLSLKAAFHKQCIGCHQDMGSGPEKCTDCHAKRKKQTEAQSETEN